MSFNKKYNKSEKDIIKCNILQKEYKILSFILCNLQNIIIENENILLFPKNQCMKSLNELIKKINELYNNSIIDIISKDNEIIVSNDSMYSDLTDIKSESIYSDKEKSFYDTESFDSVEKDDNLVSNKNKIIKKEIVKKTYYNNINLELIDDFKNIIINNNLNLFGKYNNLIEFANYNPFEEIKKQIILLCKITGFTSLKDIIYLTLNIHDYYYTGEDKDKFNLLCDIFKPLDFEILDINKKNINIEISKTETNNLILFNNQCKIELYIHNKLFKIIGYIKNDSLNIYIRTSQITNTFLYNKKISFEEIINLIGITYNSITKFNISKDLFNKLNKINKDFADIYLKNMTINDILILSNEEFILKLYNDYNTFNELNSMQFVKLIKNFTKNANENLYTMFNTIKLLLLGSDENCSVASLLFNLLKDKKNVDTNEYIANIIYQQLNYIAQLKLKKSIFNIKNELDKLKNITSSDIDLRKQVLLSKDMPDYVKKICLEKLEELKNANNETYKIKMYVNILIQFPWPSDIDDNIFKIVSNEKNTSKQFLENIESKLNTKIFGHSAAKNKTLQILAKLISVQGSHISPIALSGPPGVGKTKFAQCLAECLDIPFIQITLGGQNDGELLHGHGYTYSGAQPGLIIKKMVNAGSARCIMYFDELDKCVSKNGQVNELMSILIHLTDPMTNGSFQDRFFQEITFPLNKVIFIFSFNDVNKIDKILLDRMEILDVDSYSIKEKMIISNKYLLKELFKDIGFEDNSIIFPDDVLTNIIEDYTFEPGVRSLKRSLENILLKLNIDKIYQRGLYENDIDYSSSNPLKINSKIVLDYLGETKVSFKSIHSKDMIGVVNGLYATSLCSGGIVPIQLTANHLGNNSKFVLKLTGNQKKIMRESILYSFTTAINLLTNEGKEIFFKEYSNGIHIHTPEAATPKDGPSAGVSFTLAFLSMMLGLKVDRTVALTGEIDLYGNVTKIGGVKYKIQGAFKAKVNKVFLPSENKEDVEKVQKELPEIFDDNHQYFFIDHVLDVAEKALINWDSKKHLISKL
jgi:endopeptidase La